ncbi:MAG: DUF4142 domain-containing protein [Acidobacteriota bacterium]|nr:DUF4142 domain-containing protein [Acidobacteriota bacterium]
MRKILLIISICGLFILGLAGCETTTETNENLATNMNTNSNEAVVTNTNTTESKVADDDGEKFMTEAAQGGMAEVKLGKLAAEKAQNPEVKAFGKLMVEDHSKANNDLKEVAKKKNFTLPTDVNEDQKESYDELAKLSGKDFDAKYVEMMVDDHKKDVNAFQEQADDGEDAAVKAFAAKTLPTLKSHYEKIKAISDKMK